MPFFSLPIWPAPFGDGLQQHLGTAGAILRFIVYAVYTTSSHMRPRRPAAQELGKDARRTPEDGANRPRYLKLTRIPGRFARLSMNSSIRDCASARPAVSAASGSFSAIAERISRWDLRKSPLTR